LFVQATAAEKCKQEKTLAGNWAL